MGGDPLLPRRGAMPRSVYSMETSIDATAIITDTEGFRKTAGIVLVRGPLMALS
jgi:hypothetical protein